MSTIHYLLYFVLNISLVSLFKLNDSAYYNDYVPRVVNGHPAKLGDVPYQVAFKWLLKRTRIYTTFCGGVIMAPEKLLSAAHCFAESRNFYQKVCCGVGSKKSLSQKYAVAGNLRNRGYHSQIDSENDGQWRKLKKVIYPSTFRFPKDDIAIVFIQSPFVYNSFVNYIPIASRLIDYHGSCLVSGFGRISEKATSDILLLADLELIPYRLCNRMHRRNMKRFVCTYSKVTDVGKGDSGGPLVCSKTGDPNEQAGKGILIGIVSGNRNKVGSFFTRVSSYYKYIQRNKSQKIYLNFSVVIIIQTTFLLF